MINSREEIVSYKRNPLVFLLLRGQEAVCPAVVEDIVFHVVIEHVTVVKVIPAVGIITVLSVRRSGKRGKIISVKGSVGGYGGYAVSHHTAVFRGVVRHEVNAVRASYEAAVLRVLSIVSRPRHDVGALAVVDEEKL